MARTAATATGSHDREGHSSRRSGDHTIRGERRRESHISAIDAAALAAELRTVVRGEVRFDDGSRALYSMDASNYRQPPIGVVLPRDAEDIVQALAVCRRYGAPDDRRQAAARAWPASAATSRSSSTRRST